MEAEQLAVWQLNNHLDRIYFTSKITTQKFTINIFLSKFTYIYFYEHLKKLYYAQPMNLCKVANGKKKKQV